MADLKREVEAAFESAQHEVRETLSPLLEVASASSHGHFEVASASSPAAPQTQPVMATVAAAPMAPPRTAAPPAPQAPARHTQITQVSKRTAPPPPPPQRPKSKFETLWDGMEGGKPLDRQDPINAFAPPPSMDWGPERTSRKTRGLRRLRQASA